MRVLQGSHRQLHAADSREDAKNAKFGRWLLPLLFALSREISLSCITNIWEITSRVGLAGSRSSHTLPWHNVYTAGGYATFDRHDRILCIDRRQGGGKGSTQRGLSIAGLFSRLGYRTYMYFDYPPSLIRGGHNFAIIRASEKAIGGAHRTPVDVLLAFDQNSIENHRESIHGGTTVVHDASQVMRGGEGYGLPLDAIVKEEKAPPDHQKFSDARGGACPGGGGDRPGCPRGRPPRKRPRKAPGGEPPGRQTGLRRRGRRLHGRAPSMDRRSRS